MGSKKILVGGVLGSLLLLAGTAWWYRIPLAAWYHLHQLAQADEQNRDSCVERVIRLEAVRLGTAWKTSLEAVARFSKALTAAALPADDTPPVGPAPTPKERRRAAEAASRKADTIFGTRG